MIFRKPDLGFDYQGVLSSSSPCYSWLFVGEAVIHKQERYLFHTAQLSPVVYNGYISLFSFAPFERTVWYLAIHRHLSIFNSEDSWLCTTSHNQHRYHSLKTRINILVFVIGMQQCQLTGYQSNWHQSGLGTSRICDPVGLVPSPDWYPVRLRKQYRKGFWSAGQYHKYPVKNISSIIAIFFDFSRGNRILLEKAQFFDRNPINCD